MSLGLWVEASGSERLENSSTPQRIYMPEGVSNEHGVGCVNGQGKLFEFWRELSIEPSCLRPAWPWMPKF